MITGKRLMILGAGPFQMPAIRKAAEMGCYVITVDNQPESVGHRYSHRYVNCSTLDAEGVLSAARELGIDGICTFSSDVAIPTVARVCDEMGLPGPSPVAAETMATKHRFRRFLTEARLACPAFLSGNRFEDIFRALHRLRPPLIVKPVDTSGSRGITRLDRPERAAAEQAFLKAQGYSRSATVCVEEFVAGTEVGGDAILLDGRVAFVAITHKHLNGFVVTGHNLPTNIPHEAQARVMRSLEEVCAALGYRSGPINFDAIVTPESVTLLEMSARNGGNGIPAVIERATGVDVEKASICLALGGPTALPEAAVIRQGAGSFVFGSPRGGILEHIADPGELKRRLPQVFDIHYARRPGDRVEPFEHNGNLIGFALFDCRDASDYHRMTERIIDSLDIAIRTE